MQVVPVVLSFSSCIRLFRIFRLIKTVFVFFEKKVSVVVVGVKWFLIVLGIF